METPSGRTLEEKSLLVYDRFKTHLMDCIKKQLEDRNTMLL